ncbi:MAG: hypothetical protein LPK45_04710, partial [Bacteroidota bacterium]|nr:hypothetical protein [Bacteroidota bacterium]MDX5430357.1 hypothetical protein [Bacteroidota bacterium]MDX5469118.1 hypothetical protein [Bacteroidota bacterium]
LPRYFDGGLSEANLHLGEELPLYSTWNIYESELSDSFITTLVTEESLNIRCFQIQAIENDPNQFGFSETVHSNPKCFIQKPSIFFPNVVAVRGINNVFEPVGLSIDKKQSRIQIYTMNGQRIYDHDLTKAWTGLSEDGGPYHTTVFIYLADIYFLDGTRSQYSGNITVLY